MDLAATAINAAVVVAVGTLLGWQINSRFKALDGRIDDVKDDMATRMDGFERRMDGFERRMESFQVSIDGMRSDLMRVALAVGAETERGSGSHASG